MHVITKEYLLLTLFPPINNYQEHTLAVEPPHILYIEESGNPAGIPILFVHGGPGADATQIIGAILIRIFIGLFCLINVAQAAQPRMLVWKIILRGRWLPTWKRFVNF